MGYLNRTLASLSELPGLQRMAIYISQDGNDTSVNLLIASSIDKQLHSKAKRVEHWHHPRIPLISDKQVNGAFGLSSSQSSPYL